MKNIALAASIFALMASGAYAQVPNEIMVAPTASGGSTYTAAANGGLGLSAGAFSLGDGVGISYTSPGQLSLIGGTVTTNTKVLNITQTWNNSGTAFDAPIFANITNTASNGTSSILDLQTNGVSQFLVRLDGTVNALGGFVTGTPIVPTNLLSNAFLKLTNTSSINWSATSNSNGTSDTFLTRHCAACVQIGPADAGSPVAQTIGVQSVVAGTSNTAGANWTLIGSLSTGSGASGDIVFQTGGTGAGATVQNSAVTALTIKGATQVIQVNQIASDSGHTDATVCEDTTTHGLYSGSGTVGICLGTSSRRYKHGEQPLALGLDTIMALEPKRYYPNAGYGIQGKPLYGFMAEDGASVVPELIGSDAEGRPNTFDYLGIVPILVRAVQEQQAEIESMRRTAR